MLAASALRQHAACARTGEDHDHTSLFAMVGLWLEYGGELPEAEAELCSLPTHKLLPLIWQLACRLGASNGPDAAFQASLRTVVTKVAKAHLHTVLPHLLALSYGDRFATNEEMPPIDKGQLKAAKEVVRELREAEAAERQRRQQKKQEKAAREKAAAKNGKEPPKDREEGAESKSGGIVPATELLYDFYLQLAWATLDVLAQFAAPLGLNRLVEAIEQGTASFDTCFLWAVLVVVGPTVQIVASTHGFHNGWAQATKWRGYLCHVLVQKVLTLDAGAAGLTTGGLTNLLAVDAAFIMNLGQVAVWLFAEMCKLTLTLVLTIWLLGRAAVGGFAVALLAAPLNSARPPAGAEPLRSRLPCSRSRLPWACIACRGPAPLLCCAC